jgi:hypothetical protein
MSWSSEESIPIGALMTKFMGLGLPVTLVGSYGCDAA